MFDHRILQLAYNRAPGPPERTLHPAQPAWPAALNLEQAGIYSGLSSSRLNRLIKEGRLIGKALGPHGTKIILRSELDRVLEEILGAGMKGARIEEDFDFG